MKFSIVIPVYNVEKYLRECLESVAAQTFTDFEVICVNDGSTDNSLEIINDFKNSKFKDLKIINKENGGLSAARNAGICASEGDYIFLLDSDDFIAHNALEILNKNIDNQDFIWFSGKVFFENTKKEIIDKQFCEPKISGWDYYNKYALIPRRFHFVTAVLRLYRREFLMRNRLFFSEGIYHEDNLFTPICCYCAENVKVIPDVLYVYRIREGSITQNENPAATLKRTQDTILIINELTDFFENADNIDKTTVYRQNAMWVFNAFYILCHNNLSDKCAELKSLLCSEFKATISDFDMKLLFDFIEKDKFKKFYKWYKFDFHTVRNYWRKIKKRIKK
ncbi:MAG: glycosyltransferase [Paludibacter sp.]|nr:glycosyltransferase [Paludibacter sp.]